MNMNFEQPYQVILEPKDTFNIILVGCGGTGGYIAETTARMAWDLKQTGKNLNAIFVDHDSVEEKNIGRQRFTRAELGLNKAVCLANRYNLAFGLNISAVERPFHADLINKLSLRLLPHNSLIIGAVDNAEARQQIANAIEEKNGRLWALDAGNALHNGNVYIGNITQMSQLNLNDDMKLASGFPSPYIQNPALLKSEKKKKRKKESCAVLIQRREQSLVINQQMGSLLARYLECWLLERKLEFMHTAVSLEIPSMNTTMATKTELINVWKPLL